MCAHLLVGSMMFGIGQNIFLSKYLSNFHVKIFIQFTKFTILWLNMSCARVLLLLLLLLVCCSTSVITYYSSFTSCQSFFVLPDMELDLGRDLSRD